MAYFDFFTDTFNDQQIDELNGLAAIHEAAGLSPWDAAKQAVRDKIFEAAKGTGKFKGDKLAMNKGRTLDDSGMELHYVRHVTHNSVGDISDETYSDDYGFGITGKSLNELKKKMAEHGKGQITEDAGAKRKRTICVDFDGVIADYSKGFQGVDVFGEPLSESADTMAWLRGGGWKVIIFTTRKDTPALRKYLKDNAIPYDEINTNSDQPTDTNPGKPIADIYLDDRAFRFRGWLDFQYALRGMVKDGVFEAAGEPQKDLLKRINAGAHEAATSPKNDLPEPTPKQVEAGTYTKGHIRLYGLDISIENPEGSIRKGVSPDGKAWESEMFSHYGYIKGSMAIDKDHIDVFVGDHPESDVVFVIDQIDPKTKKYDEPKVMMAFLTEKSARRGYLENYDDGWQGLGAITKMTVDEFKEWLENGDTLRPVDREILEAAATRNGFMKSPAGVLDFGYITPEIASVIKREPAPIRLREGNASEGLLHIEMRHGKDIAALGYKNAVEFIYAITRHFDAIYPPSKPGRGLTIVVISGKLKFATIQLESVNGGAFYDIKNATPGRGDQFKNKDPLWISSAGPSTTTGLSQSPLNSLGLKTGLDDLTLPLSNNDVKAILESATATFAEKRAAQKAMLPGQATGTQILHTFPNEEDGVEAIVAKVGKGYSVVIRDTDADMIAQTAKIFQAEDAAIAYAKQLV